MRYRPYRPSDFEALYAIEIICFEPPLRFPRKYMQRLTQSDQGVTWIAENQTEMAGFAIVEWSRQLRGLVAYLATIEVQPGERQQGVGSELLRLVEQSALDAEAGLLWLHVDAENEVALRLYRRHGYAEAGRVLDYYGAGRAALAVWKPLRREP